MNILPIAINNSPAPANGATGDIPLTRNDPTSQTGKATAGTSQTGSTGNDPAAEPFARLLARQIGETAVLPPGTALISPLPVTARSIRSADTGIGREESQGSDHPRLRRSGRFGGRHDDTDPVAAKRVTGAAERCTVRRERNGCCLAIKCSHRRRPCPARRFAIDGRE